MPVTLLPIGSLFALRYSGDMILILRDMLLMLVLAVLLWLFHLYARVMPDAAVIAIWAAVSLGIAAGLVWRRLIRRSAFLRAYLAPASPLQRWLRGGWLLVLSRLFLAMCLAALLLLALVRTDDRTLWTILLLSAPLLALLRAGVGRCFRTHVNAAYLPEFSFSIAVPLLGGTMLLLLLSLAMQRSYPDFRAVSLEQAAWHLVGQEQARSPLLLPLLQIAAAGEALHLWLAQQLLPALRLPLLQWLGWVLVFVREAVFVWSFLFLCQGVLLGVHRNGRKPVDRT